MMMRVSDRIVEAIDVEIQRLLEARRLLTGEDNPPKAKVQGRAPAPEGSAPQPRASIIRSTITPDGRRRISEASKRRHAADRAERQRETDQAGD